MSVKVAVIGRPNVGKSTLFNRLVGRKLALVDDQPGVTRDRREGEARLGDLSFTIVDTAGLEEGAGATLAGRMRAQTETALVDCDAVLFLIDARAGVTQSDRHFAQAVRRAGKPVILVANKAEGQGGRDGVIEAFTLGLGDPVPISAEHGDGFCRPYGDALVAVLLESAGPDAEDDEPARLKLGDEEDGNETDPTKPLRIAIVGRPNAGKSTLLNRILGEERLLTGPEPGLTRRTASASKRPGAVGASSSSTRRACAGAPASSKSWRSSPPPTRCARCASPKWSSVLLDATIRFRETGSRDCRSRRARRPRPGDRPQQMGFDPEDKSATRPRRCAPKPIGCCRSCAARASFRCRG